MGSGAQSTQAQRLFLIMRHNVVGQYATSALKYKHIQIQVPLHCKEMCFSFCKTNSVFYSTARAAGINVSVQSGKTSTVIKGFCCFKLTGLFSYFIKSTGPNIKMIIITTPQISNKAKLPHLFSLCMYELLPVLRLLTPSS